MCQECEHLGVGAASCLVLLELNAQELTCCFLLLETAVEKMFSVNRLQLLEVTDKHHIWARAELTECCLETLPHMAINLADFVQDDQVVLPKASGRIIASISVTGYFEGRVNGFDGDLAARRQS